MNLKPAYKSLTCLELKQWYVSIVPRISMFDVLTLEELGFEKGECGRKGGVDGIGEEGRCGMVEGGVSRIKERWQ